MEPIPFAGMVEIEPVFTQDWFSHNINNFNTCMDALPYNSMFLEIGSFEGRATCWLLKNGLREKGAIACIDPYEKLDFDPSIDMKTVEATFWDNVNNAKAPDQKVFLVKEYSTTALARMVHKKHTFEFIYIDGSHAPDVVLTDACMAWQLLESGGVMLFDDYLYPHESTRVGIDGFLDAFEGKYKTIVKNYQYGIQKL